MDMESTDTTSFYPAPCAPVTAFVLAGGLGTRLLPAIADRPKVLAPAGDRPFLHYILRYLQSQGMQRVILCTGYKGEDVCTHAKREDLGMDISCSQESRPLGTGGAVRLASSDREEPFFALNGDTLFLVDLEKLWDALVSMDTLAAMALLPVEETGARGRVKLDERGLVAEFSEKPEETGPALVSGGVYAFLPEALKTIVPGETASLERDLFPRLAAEGLLAGSVQAVYFKDIGTPESLRSFERDLREGAVRL